MKYYAFDIETTGLDPKTDRIIELALITPDGPHSWIIKPENTKVPELITQLTGITQEMADEGVTFSKAINEFCDMLPLSGYKLVGHNCINFDVPFLQVEWYRHIKLQPLHYPYVDTAALFKALQLGKPFWPPRAPHATWAKQVLNVRAPGLKFNLALAAQEMGLATDGDLHRAEADATLTLKLFKAMLEKYPQIEASF